MNYAAFLVVQHLTLASQWLPSLVVHAVAPLRQYLSDALVFGMPTSSPDSCLKLDGLCLRDESAPIALANWFLGIAQ